MPTASPPPTPTPPAGERRFRAADVLTGAIDRKPAAPRRRQISAYLTPAQVRTLGELHAQLASTGAGRIEKSELVGLAVELLATVVANAEREGIALTDLAAVRAYAERTVNPHG